MCPPHLLDTWVEELDLILPSGTVDVQVLECWRDILKYPRTKPTKSTWLIAAETMLKNQPFWTPQTAGGFGKLSLNYTTEEASYWARGELSRLQRKPFPLRCPDCGAQLRNSNGNYLTMKDLERSKRKCPCGSTLWQYNRKEYRWAPCDYIHRYLRFDYLIADELHEEKSDDSARANAFGTLASRCRKIIGMTGTLTGGKASDIRSLLFRMSPQSLKVDDLRWEERIEFIRRYGRENVILTEKSGPKYDNRRSKGSTNRTTHEQPGIMPTLYGKHLIHNTIFLTLDDVAADLPEYSEHPVSVQLSGVVAGGFVEGTLADAYYSTEEALKDAVRTLLEKGSKKLLSTMLHALLAYPDYPYDWPTIGYTEVSKETGSERFVAVVTPPTLDRNTIWPKEKELLRLIAQEKAEDRQVWVFCEYTKTHPVLGRLEEIVRKAGYKVRVLDAGKVPTRNRNKWIRENAQGMDVMISHPMPVRTGLTLFGKGYNFPTLIFYQTGYNIVTLRQASRRAYRIGQELPCRVFFLYYTETMQSRALDLIADKLDASLAIEGQFSEEGLVAMANADSDTMALAKSLVERIDFGNAEVRWEKFRGAHTERIEVAEAEDRMMTMEEVFDLICNGGWKELESSYDQLT
jgi:ribosomal protein L34E